MSTQGTAPVAPREMAAPRARVLERLGAAVCKDANVLSILRYNKTGDTLYIYVSRAAPKGRGYAGRELYVFFGEGDALRITKRLPYGNVPVVSYPLASEAELQAIVGGMRLAAEISAKKNADRRKASKATRGDSTQRTLNHLATLAQDYSFAYVAKPRSTGVLVTIRLDAGAVFEVDVPHKTAMGVLRGLPKLLAAVKAAHGQGVFLRMRKVESSASRRFRWVGVQAGKKALTVARVGGES